MQDPEKLAKRIEEIKETYFNLQAQKQKLLETLEAIDKALTELVKEAEGLGTTLPTEPFLSPFQMSLKSESSPQLKNKDTAFDFSRQKKKVLVIDDDPVTLRLITYFLEREGFVVDQAESGEEGLKKILVEKPDLLLLDIMMPGINGFQLAEKLQASPELVKLPIIFLSSLADEEDVLRGLKAGWDYIIKPFSPPILLAKIEKLLKIKHESFSQPHSL
ncbi:MAG: response regulator [Candidatus Aminicenantes bacterium]|nr:response regulator [Candidatus Aminicenantes bacterium]